MSDLIQDIDVVAEWDKNAEARHHQIVSKIDISYHTVLIPTLLRFLGEVRDLRIIDVGCGSGVFVSELAKRGAFVVGVDPSKEMIRIANREYECNDKIEFYSKSIQEFSSHASMKFDIAVSNMSLITIEDLDGAVNSISTLLKSQGRFIFNITHPYFWNRYRQYEPDEIFEYKKEHPQRGKFIISNDLHGLPSPTTHFHRPLERYFQCLLNASFMVENIEEPFPSWNDMKLYTIPWKFPRFLSMNCKKLKNYTGSIDPSKMLTK